MKPSYQAVLIIIWMAVPVCFSSLRRFQNEALSFIRTNPLRLTAPIPCWSCYVIGVPSQTDQSSFHHTPEFVVPSTRVVTNV